MEANKENLTAWRVVSQKLNGSSLNTMVDVLKWLVGVQAQDASGGMWSIGLRGSSGKYFLFQPQCSRNASICPPGFQTLRDRRTVG